MGVAHAVTHVLCVSARLVGHFEVGPAEEAVEAARAVAAEAADGEDRVAELLHRLLSRRDETLPEPNYRCFSSLLGPSDGDVVEKKNIQKDRGHKGIHQTRWT